MRNFTESDVKRWTTSNGKPMAKIYFDTTKDLVECMLPWQKKGLQETSTGYGGKLTSSYKIQYCGKLYRLYVTCYSNCASHWFTVKGQTIYVD
jgi:hypothetical protein